MRRQSEPNVLEKARNKLPSAIGPTRLFASGNDSKQLRQRKISRVFKRGPLVILRSPVVQQQEMLTELETRKRAEQRGGSGAAAGSTAHSRAAAGNARGA